MRKLFVITIISVILLLSGCRGDGGSEPKRVPLDFDLDITEYHSEALGTNKYYYVIDDRTGVVYIAYETGYRGGITVALNSDGTPVTKDQLGLGI